MPLYPEVSLVIPVYNEEALIKKSIAIIDEQIKKVTNQYEIIIIDDGSSDNTWMELIELNQQIPNVACLKLSRNFGKEYALSAGIEQAKGKAVIIMDADLQHPPSLLSEMIKIWREDNVGIVECVKRDRGKESIRNKIGAKLFYSLLKTLTGYNLQGASDFKLLDKKVVQAWSQMPEKNLFFRGMTAWVGFKRVRLEFDVAERADGETKWSLVKLIKLSLNAIVSFTSLPLRIVSIIGILFFIAAIILGIQTLYHKLNGTAVTGFTTVILLQLIIGSVVMTSLGIIGEYISAIYNEVKGRPRYIIQEMLTTNGTHRSENKEKELISVHG